MDFAQIESLLDVYEVARRLNVCKDTVYRWSRRGVLPSIRLPGETIRWDPKDIDKFQKRLTIGKF
jgi:excisionase family DNA binding protein